MGKLKTLLTMAMVCGAVPVMASASDDSFDSNGMKIRYVAAGEGETVVLIHGWMSDSSMWGRDSSGNTKLDASNSSGFRLVALDCRGHGKSDKPHDPDRYGAEMAADVVRLLDHLHVKKAHLIGYSMGTYIAAKVAATHPERVLSIVYGGQAPLLPGEGRGSREVDVFAKAVDEGKDLGSYIVAVTPPDRPKPTMELANAVAKMMFAGKDVKAFAAAGRSFAGLEVTASDLKRCQAPVLFIYGSKDAEGTKARVAKVRALLGHGEVKVIEGADHITALTNREFGQSIADFLKAHREK